MTSRAAKFIRVEGAEAPASPLRRYPVRLTPEADGGFSVVCPALPGAVSEGDTEAEALANIAEAIRGLLAAYAADGQPVPWRPGYDVGGCKYVFVADPAGTTPTL